MYINIKLLSVRTKWQIVIDWLLQCQQMATLHYGCTINWEHPMIFGLVMIICSNILFCFDYFIFFSDNSSIISQLNVGVLRNIKMCFVDLQGNVKLKLLLSFLHISRRNLDEVIDYQLFCFCFLIVFL